MGDEDKDYSLYSPDVLAAMIDDAHDSLVRAMQSGVGREMVNASLDITKYSMALTKRLLREING